MLFKYSNITDMNLLINTFMIITQINNMNYNMTI